LAGYLMGIIREAVPDAAVPLVARVLAEAGERPTREEEILSRARSLARRDDPLDFEAALRTLVMRRLVRAERGGYRPAPGSEKILDYYASSVYR
ncbi:MAG TPA: hypothetical protein VGP38_00825, partial [Rubrobacter sp.]|nr:hypothetical protein [Rubrobacter sp.]